MGKLLVQFLVSGGIVTTATFMAPRLGQKWAGLIVAAPLITLITFVFLSMESKTDSLHDYLLSALLFMIPAAVFIGCLLFFNGKMHFVINVLISFCIFAVVVWAMLRLKLV